MPHSLRLSRLALPQLLAEVLVSKFVHVAVDVALSPARTITSCEFVYVYGVNKHLVFFLSLSDVYLRSSSHELQCDPLWFGIVHV